MTDVLPTRAELREMMLTRKEFHVLAVEWQKRREGVKPETLREFDDYYLLRQAEAAALYRKMHPLSKEISLDYITFLVRNARAQPTR